MIFAHGFFSTRPDDDASRWTCTDHVTLYATRIERPSRFGCIRTTTRNGFGARIFYTIPFGTARKLLITYAGTTTP